MTRLKTLVRRGLPTVRFPTVIGEWFRGARDGESDDPGREEPERDQPCYSSPDIDVNVRTYTAEDIQQHGIELYSQLRAEGFSKEEAAEAADIAVRLHGIEVDVEGVKYGR